MLLPQLQIAFGKGFKIGGWGAGHVVNVMPLTLFVTALLRYAVFVEFAATLLLNSRFIKDF